MDQHQKDCQHYLEIVTKRSQSGISREHSYRADLEALIRALVSGVEITNEPANVTECGNPDYVITRAKIPIGFIEAKDIGKDLNHKQYQAQFSRYKKALDNLIITDYLWFQFFQNGELVHEIRIADFSSGKVTPLTENFAEFTNLIQNFCNYDSQTIKSPKKLAEHMAAKARLLENILEKAIVSDETSLDNTALQQQYTTFKSILIHDLTPQGFADIYAQTLAYGMFAARLHDTSLDTFSRQEAAELIPKSNPFLRKLFSHVAGVDIDPRIKTTVDNLADVFRATNVEELLKNFGKNTPAHIEAQDPIIHFYETFLAEYDPKLRKARGVWYTPEPVVKFIVRAVDDLLKTEFNLKDGLADTTTTTIKVKTDQSDRRTKSGVVELEKQVHKVQVLDPATGTGTFLAEVVKFIHRQKFKAMQGAWSGYVEDHLIPRLNGFELLMASYSMAHLKLDMLLSQTGYIAKKNQRFNIFLTNSLEEHHPETGTLFSSWLSNEANEADAVKRDAPVMVVLGNPPYAVSSSNKSEWIQELLKDYKKDLNEKNIQPLSDDYIKFIRYGQYFIEKNGEGILAYISNNSFLDGLIHRQMRNELLSAFDKIYILDLHGNSKKKETAPDGGKDENVFDIMQGVSINLFIKTGPSSTKHAEVYHVDVYGKRQQKYELLMKNKLLDLPFEKLEYRAPEYFFVKKDFKVAEEYEQGFSLNDLFLQKSSGIKTHRDHFVIDLDRQVLQERIQAFFNPELSDNEVRLRFKLKDTSNWKTSMARSACYQENKLKSINYRPFDNHCIYYDNALIDRGREQFMQHFLLGNNLGLLLPRQAITEKFGFFITDKVCDINFTGVAGQYGAGLLFPLYLYPNQNQQQNLDKNQLRQPNLNAELVNKLAQSINLRFTPEKEEPSFPRSRVGMNTEANIKHRTHSHAGAWERETTFAPIDLLDYIYAVLHSPGYRQKYKEFLKIDFPRIPWPKDATMFWSWVKLGGQLRRVHLLEAETTDNFITRYPIDGDNVVTRKTTKKDWQLYDSGKQLGRIWINDNQYFDQIPLTAWEFYIGGYQPAQKWLKDRSGRTLNFDDILHYQKIIKALVETGRIMQQIDNITFE
jgi:predicted helicase